MKRVHSPTASYRYGYGQQRRWSGVSMDTPGLNEQANTDAMTVDWENDVLVLIRRWWAVTIEG